MNYRCCQNPKCRFHSHIIEEVANPALVKIVVSCNLTSYKVEVVVRHPYFYDGFAPIPAYYLCDKCHKEGWTES